MQRPEARQRERLSVCKRSSGWISYDNYIHDTTKRKNVYLIATFRSPDEVRR